MRQLLEIHASAAKPGVIGTDLAIDGSACGRSQQKLGRQRLKKVSCSDPAHHAESRPVFGTGRSDHVKSFIRNERLAAAETMPVPESIDAPRSGIGTGRRLSGSGPLCPGTYDEMRAA
jgi:hypothetical protein